MNYKLVFTMFGIPGILILLATPLVFSMIPPNEFYGFRTTKSMSSEETWYAINKASGVYLLIAGTLACILNGIFGLIVKSDTWIFWGCILITSFLILGAVLLTALKLKSM